MHYMIKIYVVVVIHIFSTVILFFLLFSFFIVIKETITVEKDDDIKERDKSCPLRLMHHLHDAYQKLITHL